MPPKSDLTFRTLRFWGVADLIYAALITLVVAAYIPWKTPAVNIALLIYAGFHASAAPGLFRRTRWGFRMGVVGGIVGLVAAVFTCTGLLASWAYLHGVFGDFGRGASLGALLCASVVLQILGLYPALKLRALLRREVRQDFGVGPGIIRALFAMLVLSPSVALGIHLHYHVECLPPVSTEGQNQVVSYLRAALDQTHRPALCALEGVPTGPGPLYVTLWSHGRAIARVAATGQDLRDAVIRAANVLMCKMETHKGQFSGGRLKIDRVVGICPVLSEARPVLALSVNPGRDGLRRQGGEPLEAVLPDDLVKEQSFGRVPMFPGIRGLRLGLNADSVLARLGLSGGAIERMRTESWVEYRDKALPVSRCNTPGPKPGPEEWRKAAVEGGHFILRQLTAEGRFLYRYLPTEHRHSTGSAYSTARHAGTAYCLALLYGRTGKDCFRTAAEEALSWLEKQMPEECGSAEQACIVSRGHARLGNTALALVAMLEYQRRTGSAAYEGTIRRCLGFVRTMQRPNGDFYHLYDLTEDRPDPSVRRMFSSGQAALALVMAHDVLGDEASLRAAEQALDYLTGPKYDYFLGRFIYGDDHWTCIAAEEAWPHLRSSRYLDFCGGYSRFIGRLQYKPGEWDNADYTGHFGFGALAVPGAPVTASAAEALVSTYLLSEHHGRPDEAVKAQATLALNALVRDQVRLDNAWLLPDPVYARGAIRFSLVEQEVRIDYTQHSASALIRGGEMEITSEQVECRIWTDRHEGFHPRQHGVHGKRLRIENPSLLPSNESLSASTCRGGGGRTGTTGPTGQGKCPPGRRGS